MKRVLSMFLWIGLLALIWPLTHYLVFVIRFPGSPPPEPSPLIFLPMGAISGGILMYLVDLARSQQQRLLTVLGYALASPLAFIGSIGGGLILEPIVGATLLGVLPLAIGTLAGFWLGQRFAADA
jgi:hypothetical protein